MHTPNFDYKFCMAWAGTELCGLCLGIPGFSATFGLKKVKKVQSDCWFPYAPMSRGVVRHQVSSRMRSVESSP